MRSESSPIGQESARTFTETARRAQIVAAAIDTIAELGYGQASLARIAETAGTSKGVIIYHFGGKDELIRELVAGLVARGVAYMEPQVDAEPTGAGQAAGLHRVQPGLHAREPQSYGRDRRDRAQRPRRRRQPALRLLGPGRRGGRARAAARLFPGHRRVPAGFDPHVMAMAIRAAINAVPAQLARDPALDVGHHAREIADMFHIATRPGSNPVP